MKNIWVPVSILFFRLVHPLNFFSIRECKCLEDIRRDWKQEDAAPFMQKQRQCYLVEIKLIGWNWPSGSLPFVSPINTSVPSCHICARYAEPTWWRKERRRRRSTSLAAWAGILWACRARGHTQMKRPSKRCWVRYPGLPDRRRLWPRPLCSNSVSPGVGRFMAMYGNPI